MTRTTHDGPNLRRREAPFGGWSLALALAGALGLALGACGTGAPTPTPIAGLAPVDSLDLLMLESFPLQVHALVMGQLPDDCTVIDQAVQQRQDNYITVTLTTVRPFGTACRPGAVPYEHRIPLEVAGLRAGVYTVSVNGITNSFELTADNVLPPSPGASPSP